MAAQSIQLRRGTAAQWTAANPTLHQGELGVETDTGKVKLGNGSTAWNAQAYIADAILTAAEKTKLAGIAPAATANDTDANLKNRANHTNTQSADTITDGTTNKAYTATEKTKLAGAEIQANKNVANGYAGLDGSGVVAAAQLPSYVDDVLEYANLAAFPGTGTTGKIYTAIDTGKIYRWSGSVYVEISPSPGSTDSVTEGSTNLYYTAARADARAVAQIAAATATGTGALVRASTPTITTPVLTGLPTGTGVAVAPTVSTLASRDAAANTAANNHINNAATQATAATTTTLTVASAQFQQFTGTTTQTVVLPDATTLRVGQSFIIANRSTGAVAVNANGGSGIGSVVSGSQSTVTLLVNGSAAGTWDLASAGAGGGITAASINLTGTYASLPAAGTAGRLYVCTDIGNVYRDNGTTWVLVSIDGEVGGTEPPSTSWSTTTLGSATFAADKGGRLCTNPSASGTNWRIEYRTLTPTSNYTFTVRLEATPILTNYTDYGIILRNSVSGSFISFGGGFNTASASGSLFNTYKWTNVTTASAGYAILNSYAMPQGNPTWLRVRDDGTARYFEYSYGGTIWGIFSSVGRTDFITPDQVGWGCNNNTTGVSQSVRLRSWSLV